MIKLNNNINFNYEKARGDITSICIGFKAGALQEEQNFGINHLIEHGVFLGTEKRSEKQITKEFDKYFGIYNAMTNYSYVVYYGVFFNKDFKEAVDLLGDILTNARFPKDQLEKEKKVICQEIDEWFNDPDKVCEYKLHKLIYKNRLAEIIHGNKTSVMDIDRESVLAQYKNLYTADNCTITILTSLEREEVIKGIEEKFVFNQRCKELPSKKVSELDSSNENKLLIKNKKLNTNVSFIFNLEGLDFIEKQHFLLVDYILANGSNSLLFNLLRTELALIYDIDTSLRLDLGVENYIINITCKDENAGNIVEAVSKLLDRIEEEILETLNREFEMIKSKINFSFYLRQERAVQRVKDMCVDKIMFNDYNYSEKLRNIETLDYKSLEEVFSRMKDYKWERT